MNSTERTLVSDKLKILWYAPHFRTGRSSGSLRTWQLGKFLAANRHQVSVICPNFDPLTEERIDKSLKSLSSTEVIDKVQVIRTYSSRTNRTSILKRAIYFISQSISGLITGLSLEKPNIIIAANIPIVTALAAFFIARVRRLPFVIEVRDIPVEAAIVSSYLKDSLFTRLLLKIDYYLYHNSSSIIAVTPGIMRHLVQIGVPARKIYVNSNGYEEENFQDNNPRILDHINLDNKFAVLYAGTIGHVTDVMTLLRAAEVLINNPDIVFVFVGSGQREFEYQNYCEEKNLSNCIFLGRKPRNEIPSYCAAVDVCINLFPKEPFWGHMFGNKNFDYLGSAKPYIYVGSEPSDTGDLIRSSNSGLVVEPENPEALCDAIIHLYDNPELCKKMGESGKAYVQKEYSRAKLADEFESVLLQTVADFQAGRN